MSQNIWAMQGAVVIADKAVVYSDATMTTPVGYIRRGKKIKIGNTSKNNAQVYPLMVSGKVAYIRVVDINTEQETPKSKRLLTERFQRSTEVFDTRYAANLFMFPSSVNLSKGKGVKSLTWNGLAVRGEVRYKQNWALEVLINYMQGTEGEETFRAFELGGGGSYRFFEEKTFEARVYGQALVIPFANYSMGDDFRVNGYGYTVGAGGNINMKLNLNWGVEAYAGLYYTGLSGFNVPTADDKVSATFIGSRLGIGANYRF